MVTALLWLPVLSFCFFFPPPKVDREDFFVVVLVCGVLLFLL